MALTKTDLADLKRAKELLENPGLAAKLTSMLGSPIEKGMKMLPARWQKTVHKATEAALMKALSIAVASLGEVFGAPLLAWIFLDETPPPLTLVGGALVLLGVVLAIRPVRARSA